MVVEDFITIFKILYSSRLNYILASVTAPPFTIFKPSCLSGSLVSIGEAPRINEEININLHGHF